MAEHAGVADDDVDLSRRKFLTRATIATGAVKKLADLKREGSRLPDIAVSPDGRTILYTSRDSLPTSSAALDVARLTNRHP